MARQLNVLLVEDHAMLGEMMQQMLRMLDCQAKLVASAKDATAAAGPDYDLVLCDLNLPDGTAADVRKAFPTDARTKFYILSAFDEETLRAETRAAKFDGYLAKPVEMDDLQALLDSLR